MLQNNSAAKRQSISVANTMLVIMGKPRTARTPEQEADPKKASKLTPEQWEDSKRLRGILKPKLRDMGISQAEFARRYEIGDSESIVSLYVNGWTALNIDVLLKFARGLDVSPADISPSLSLKLGIAIEKMCGQMFALFNILPDDAKAEVRDLVTVKALRHLNGSRVAPAPVEIQTIINALGIERAKIESVLTSGEEDGQQQGAVAQRRESAARVKPIRKPATEVPAGSKSRRDRR